MTLAITLSVIAGIAIGFRFKVFMVLPVMIAAAWATAAFGTTAAYFWSMASAGALSAIAVQAGYVCGTFAASMREAPVAAAVKRAPSPANAYRAHGKSSA